MTPEDRWEFRAWDANLVSIRRELERLGTVMEATTSEEIYLVARATDLCDAKVRAGKLDLKVLLRAEQGLEQWSPVLKAEFPLTRALIRDQFFPRLDIDAPPLSRAEYALDEFLGVVRAEPKIQIVNVLKERLKFDVLSCAAEFAAVKIDGIARHTIAVESEQPAAVSKLIATLGIGQLGNTSYVREIKRLVPG